MLAQTRETESLKRMRDCSLSPVSPAWLQSLVVLSMKTPAPRRVGVIQIVFRTVRLRTAKIVIERAGRGSRVARRTTRKIDANDKKVL